MVFEVKYKGDALIFAGDQLCDDCCGADIVVTGHVIAGLSNAGGKLWLEGTGKDIVRTATTIYTATATGVRRYTLSGAYIDTLTTLNCNGLDIDAGGNIYIAHNRAGGVSVTKINSVGAVQWTYDTGDHTRAIKLNAGESRVAIGGDRADTGPGDRTLWVLATTDGAEQWTFHPGTPWTIVSVDWDAFGNVYVVDPRGGTGVMKINSTPAIVWEWNLCTEVGGPCTDLNTYAHVITDNVYVYLSVSIGSVSLRALTVSGDPGSGEGREVWSGAGGTAAALDASGNLYTVDPGEDVRSIDPSTGGTIWTTNNVVVTADSIHAGSKPSPLPWSCNNTYVAGDLADHDGAVRQAKVNHISCGDEVWSAKNWTIGDRCFWPTQNESNAYRLTNSNKTGADTTPPNSDADWIEDNDEPGSGNNWTDYWD